jgi:hypothetical protein
MVSLKTTKWKIAKICESGGVEIMLPNVTTKLTRCEQRSQHSWLDLKYKEYPLEPIGIERIRDIYPCNTLRPAYVYRAIESWLFRGGRDSVEPLFPNGS